MENLVVLIQKRIAQIEQNQKASSVYSEELNRAPNYARDEMLIGMVNEGMAIGSREWIVLKSLLNGGLAAEGGIFPPFGSYMHTNHLGHECGFTIKEFFFKYPNNEYAKIQYLDGSIEDVSVHFFIGCKLQPISIEEMNVRAWQEAQATIMAQGDVAYAD